MRVDGSQIPSEVGETRKRGEGDLNLPPVIRELRPFEEELEDRDVAFNGLTNDDTPLLQLNFLEETPLRSACPV